MKRTKTPDKQIKRSLPSSGTPGPKSSCTKEVIQETYRLCLLGMTNKQLSEWFNKDITTIEYWYRNKPRFRQAVDKGRKHADGKVAEALYHAALGYEHESVKFFRGTVTEKEYDEDGNLIKEKKYPKIQKVTYTKKYKPDTKAAEKFLGVRNRDTWGQADKVKHEHAHLHSEVNMNSILDELSDYSDEELQALAKLGMEEKVQKITNGQS